MKERVGDEKLIIIIIIISVAVRGINEYIYARIRFLVDIYGFNQRSGARLCVIDRGRPRSQSHKRIRLTSEKND